MDENHEPPLERPSINSPIAVQEVKKLLFLAVGSLIFLTGYDLMTGSPFNGFLLLLDAIVTGFFLSAMFRKY
jgi:hypothetical protein